MQSIAAQLPPSQRPPLLVLLVVALLLWSSFISLFDCPCGVEARGGRRGGKGKGKSNLQFAQVAEFSLISTQLADNRSAHIVTGSHFSQIFRLGFKLVIICKARGTPRPMIKWYKEGVEMLPKANVHVGTGRFRIDLLFPLDALLQYYEKPVGDEEIWNKLEIDPATMGDQGIYACVANNQYGVMAKNFKAEYTY